MICLFDRDNCSRPLPTQGKKVRMTVKRLFGPVGLLEKILYQLALVCGSRGVQFREVLLSPTVKHRERLA
jgi:hypothetical protein